MPALSTAINVTHHENLVIILYESSSPGSDIVVVKWKAILYARVKTLSPGRFITVFYLDNGDCFYGHTLPTSEEAHEDLLRVWGLSV